MNKHKIIHLGVFFKTFFTNIIGSRYVLVILDTILTIIISVHTSMIDTQSKDWWNKLYIYVGISIFVNIICILADKLKTKENTWSKYYQTLYDIHNKINCGTSTKLYRVNKKVTTAIRTETLEKGEINSIADFQTLSFDICKELHSFVINSCNCKECEVTIFQRFTDDIGNDFVTMIAYKNSQNRQPTTYGKIFYLNSKKKNPPLFIDIFKDVNADIKILHNKRRVKKDFSYFDDSLTREEKICQYIGIPIRTTRNKVEILLQIDVSKNRVFGMRYKTVKNFAENMFLPFANLLYCSYERDLILNKFYDVLEENILNKRGK